MSQLPVKKKRQQAHNLPADPQYCVRFPEVVLCLVERKMGISRKTFLTERVTHVVSENNSGNEVVEWLKRKGNRCMDAMGNGLALLDFSWFTESMSAGRPVTAQAETLASKCQVAEAYACQRWTPLEQKNQILTEALEILAEEAHFCGSEGRSLAFSRAASVLKSLPWMVRKIQELHSLPCIGEHSRRVIQEVLEDGVSAEVERVRQSERYQTMKLFTKIFGVGVKIASRWYQEGLRTLADLQVHHTKLNKEQRAGKELAILGPKRHDMQGKKRIGGERKTRIPEHQIFKERSEAEAIAQVVREGVERCLPGASVTLTGGFRSIHRNSFQSFEDEDQEISNSTSTMDHFERCFSIFCLSSLPGGIPKAASEGQGSDHSAPVFGTSSSWKAVRVDLVVTPFGQFPYALLGWTGSRNFERDLRRFAKHEKKMVLNSHVLYDPEKRTFLTAASEEDIFHHLGLEYIPPEERNA
ncbi:hypothetical protein JD844_031031 [Phrynosoma platyrhinos]|uniref:DNA-directed DNA/RNA polymerase mu n=1 Tax=Phrynosoma platyrhinos TaxID=52577 RepID=A0ABQ7T0R4_PHRPL|nr:hypothetical protein JD844_031031 [Phrynosoma platyrhinos]